MPDLLFYNADLRSFLTRREQALSKEIGSLSEDRVLKSALESLCDYFIKKYQVDAIEIDESGIQVDYDDAQVDVSHRFEYAVFDRSRPAYVDGTRIIFHMPFTGDPQLFKYKPSTFNLSPPRVDVRGNELVFVYDRTTQEVPNIRNEFERDRKNVKDYIGWIAADLQEFNSTIRQVVNQQIGARREKLLEDRKTVENIGFPIRRRSDVPTTYVSPEVKRRIAPELPPISTEPYMPEPIIDMMEYEHILTVVSNMVMVMERSPRAFKDMGEEDLRQHLLVQLNGQYEGQATGETFNFEGKTDILIRVNGKNIFIAECKFWSGPSGLNNALDQLLGYASWRDTKTALLLFNRDRNTSTLLERIPEIVKNHSNYKRESTYDCETGFRYTFGHRDDLDRELTLTILVFDIPG